MLEPVDQKRITQSIARAESGTAAEIVCVLARSSSSYSMVPLVWAAAVALSAPAPLITLTSMSAQKIYIVQIIVFIVFGLLLSIGSIRIHLVPRRIKRLRAYTLALRQFQVRGMSSTSGRTGVLIFVSLAEHYARIMVDDEIEALIPKQQWQQIVDNLALAMREGQVTDGFVNAVESCGALLADHLPPRESAGNEIPDKIYLI